MPVIPQRIPFIVSGSGTEVSLGLATAADTAQTAIGAQFTHYALSVTAIKSKSAAVGIATQPGTAQAIGARKRAAVGLATETTAAQTGTGTKLVVVRRVDSNSSALEHSILVIQGSITHQALPVAVRIGRRIDVGLIDSAATPQAMSARRSYPVNVPEAGDEVQVIDPLRTYGINPASEVSSAPVVPSRKTLVTGLATSDEQTWPDGRRKHKAAAQSTGAGTAQQIRATRLVAIGPASETTEARGTTAMLSPAPPASFETAQPVGVVKTLAVGFPVVEVSATHAATPLRPVVVGLAVETDTPDEVIAQGAEKVILTNGRVRVRRFGASVRRGNEIAARHRRD